MTIGQLVRKLLGKNLFPIVGRYYRSFFVDLASFANAIDALIPQGAKVLDIGGGDGEPLNYLLRNRPDVKVTMVDLSPSIGWGLHQEFLPRVTIIPKTALKDLMKSPQAFDVILISDVLHHVPSAMRQDFLSDVREAAGKTQAKVVILKDVAPGSFKAFCAYISDRYISGDRQVSFMTREDLKSLAQSVFGQRDFRFSSVAASDNFNFILSFAP